MDEEELAELRKGRICPIYTLSPMKILGLSEGSALVAGLVFGVGYYLTSPYIALLLAIALAYGVEKAGAGRENGYVVHWVSAHAKGKFVKGVANTWTRLGLMSPPNHQSTYEP